MVLSREERETIIRWDASSNTAEVYTADPFQWARLDKCPDIYHYIRQDTMKGKNISKTYHCEKRFITFRKSDLKAVKRVRDAISVGSNLPQV